MAWPTTKLLVKTSLGLGADPAADPDAAAYIDVSVYAFDRTAPSSTVITRGRTDESTVAQPASTTQDMKNTDGRFSPRNPTGPYFGTLRRNTPFRTEVDPGTGYVVRNTVFATELPPRWDPAEADHHVEIAAHGILRRLQQGQSPLRSALFRWATGVADTTYDAPTLLEYWPLEDGSDSRSFASELGGKSIRVGTGVDLASSSDIPGSAPLPVISTGGYVSGYVRPYTSTGEVVFQCFAAIPEGGLLNGQKLTDALFTGGSFKQCAVRYGTGGSLNVQIFNSAGTVLDETGAIGYAVDGKYIFLNVILTQDGADVDVSVNVFVYSATEEVAFSSVDDTFPARTMGKVTEIGFARDKGVDGAAVGHLIFSNVSLGTYSVTSAMNGYRGELAGARFLRLCDEENLPVAGFAGLDLDTYAMGVQRPAKLIDLFRECEAASLGVLHETRQGQLILHTAAYRENKPAALVLDYAAFHLAPPLEPTDDDQLTRNRVTVTAVGGSSATVSEDDPDVRLSTVNVGIYDEEVTVNLDATDEDLPSHHAGWRVNLGTADGLRLPTVTMNLRASSSLVATWLSGNVDIGSHITITNLPDHISYDDVELVVEGYTEQISQRNWIVTLNCAPYKPYQVAVLAEDTMTLLTAEDTTSTSWRAANSDAPFTTDSSDFPLAMRIDGEVVSVGDSFPVAADVLAGTPAHGDNASVVPALPTHLEGDVLLVFAAIRNSGVGVVDLPAGYTSLAQFGNARIMGKYATSAADSAPTITFTGGAVGDTTSAVVVRARGCQLSAVNVVTQLNGSAQDIAFPVYVQTGDYQAFLFAWKQDDYTSVAPPGVFTVEVVEASTVTGNDQSLYVARQGVGGDAAPAPASTVVVTGGAAAISRVIMLSLPRGVVDLTPITRSVNGVVTSHARGATMQVDEPVNLAL